MRGIGTLVNVLAVVLGGLLGAKLGTYLRPKVSETLMHACGLATIFIGISGTLSQMFTVENGRTLSADGTMLIILSLVLGGLLGEMVDLEKRLDRTGEKLRQLVHAKNDSRFVDGFVSASLIICIGAMAVVGSIQDGLTGNGETLYAKSVLDLIIVMVLASTMGIGAAFSAVSVGVYQGLITLFAVWVAPLLSDSLIQNLSMVGSVLIFAVGCNVAFGKKFRVGNLLPALLVPVFWEVIDRFWL